MHHCPQVNGSLQSQSAAAANITRIPTDRHLEDFLITWCVETIELKYEMLKTLKHDNNKNICEPCTKNVTSIMFNSRA